jgi:hypothetical protein
MTAAYPLPLHEVEGLDVFPMDDAYLATLPDEVREAILAAEARIEGGSAVLVPHAARAGAARHLDAR